MVARKRPRVPRVLLVYCEGKTEEEYFLRTLGLAAPGFLGGQRRTQSSMSQVTCLVVVLSHKGFYVAFELRSVLGFEPL